MPGLRPSIAAHRLLGLESLTSFIRDQRCGSSIPRGFIEGPHQYFLLRRFDWNAILELHNSVYDSLEKAADRTAFADRTRGAEAVLGTLCNPWDSRSAGRA